MYLISLEFMFPQLQGDFCLFKLTSEIVHLDVRDIVVKTLRYTCLWLFRVQQEISDWSCCVCGQMKEFSSKDWLMSRAVPCGAHNLCADNLTVTIVH